MGGNFENPLGLGNHLGEEPFKDRDDQHFASFEDSEAVVEHIKATNERCYNRLKEIKNAQETEEDKENVRELIFKCGTELLAGKKIVEIIKENLAGKEGIEKQKRSDLLEEIFEVLVIIKQELHEEQKRQEEMRKENPPAGIYG